ncbi:hypothetical protein [Noviherbaspirillum humi]|nr:hypothetical protein [Noviherbaspirillum humi]
MNLEVFEEEIGVISRLFASFKHCLSISQTQIANRWLIDKRRQSRIDLFWLSTHVKPQSSPATNIFKSAFSIRCAASCCVPIRQAQQQGRARPMHVLIDLTAGIGRDIDVDRSHLATARYQTYATVACFPAISRFGQSFAGNAAGVADVYAAIANNEKPIKASGAPLAGLSAYPSLPLAARSRTLLRIGPARPANAVTVSVRSMLDEQSLQRVVCLLGRKS